MRSIIAMTIALAAVLLMGQTSATPEQDVLVSDKKVAVQANGSKNVTVEVMKHTGNRASWVMRVSASFACNGVNLSL